MREQPGFVLMRHFFAALFDFGFLSDEGAESLKRALLGSLAVALALGLLLTRVFMAKYAMLSEASPDVYQRALVADHAFLIAEVDADTLLFQTIARTGATVDSGSIPRPQQTAGSM